ncbi:hypothetical protein L0657_27230 [Dyadobacter sp. CY345]|uniref:hypothetical protein n=1 Tax=Dyadobacter sp. CY345 TaxID=2909335 RepID=UPI001F2B915B|nr:hypothetical protein [Dyadobacter sp. CY345]MCF2447678.1 hypothetical protein [Dyadobacter sp. CY345]
MEHNLEPGDLVESSFDGIWNVQNMDSESVKCFRYDDDWERHEREFGTDELKVLQTNPDNIILPNAAVTLSSGGPKWTVCEILETTAKCKMSQDFGFMEVELPLKSLMNVIDNSEKNSNIDL